jgi:poly-gamma-glutamate synthesis protein (capsule biosynthesis protein)
MRWLALAAPLLLAWALAGCGPPPASPLAAAPTATVTATLEPSPADSATATHSPQPPTPLPPTATAPPAPTATRRPSPTPSPSPSPSPTLPPPLPPTDGQPLSFSLGWQLNANGHLTAGTFAERGGRPHYLLTSLGRTLYALADNGNVVWQARASGPIYALAVLAGEQTDERIATGDDGGYVTLFDAGGRRLWRYATGSRVTSLAAWQEGVLAAGWDERLTFLSLDGQVRWQASLGGPASAIAARPELAVVATLDGKILALDVSGSEVWHLDAGAPVVRLDATASAQGPALLAGLQDGRLLALDARGALLWQQGFGAGTAGSPIWHVTGASGDALPAIVAGTGGATPLLAVLTTGGEVLWRVALASPVQALAATDLDGDGEGEILAGLASGEILALDGQGQARGSVHAGLPVWGLEAAPDGSALVRADVVAWQLKAGQGPAGGAWLPSPPLLPRPMDSLPEATRRRAGEAILVFLGDVSPGRSMEAQLMRYGPAYPWQGLDPLLQGADLAVANLEGVLTTQGTPLDKPYLIRAHPRWGQTLAAGNLGLVTLANNHALDFGQVGLDETLDTLSALGITAIGAGRSREEAHRPALFTVDGVRIAVLGYAAARWNGSADVPVTERIAWAQPDVVSADVRAARDEADLVIVVLHAGTEYAAQPSADQVAVAHAAIDAGAGLVVGHHPHVTQTVERYGQGLIVYSLGDAVFDIPRPAAMRGDLLRIHVTADGLAQAELWPFWIEDAIRPRLLDNGQGAPQVEVIYP